ncbi:DUF4236 domain-containing protein [Rummeliibacillus stabekisii]|uniref:DUF4236 domain-containing protein n=1 Tax=Rummeliibacillus stabekisii TaxID=241244 RepID=UPI00116EE386|nr:DUF4236 domain-containing protein [Rummeliibacillus stabekisii]MBB5171625.1 hypothetical protein [Rummeliibacillus stabekisii]GEL05471.1 hypothetical protein RST01_20980 [Rummeliibacillus stabekisii]
MGLRFRKSLKVAPGVRLNISNKSTGLSFGGKGLRYSINSNGRRTTSVGIPGTGISYVTSSSNGKPYQTKSYQDLQKLKAQEKIMLKEHEQERAKYEVELFNNCCEIVKSIHKECDEKVDWKNILNSKPPYPFGEIGPKEKNAIDKYEEYKPRFFEWLFKKDEKAYIELSNQIEQAKMEDENLLKEWSELTGLAKKVLDGDIHTYFRVIEEMNPLDDLSEFGSGFEFSTDDSSIMEVEFDVHSDKIIPKEEKKLTKTGKLSIKQMTKTRYFELQQDYICSCILRIARDLFALLPLETVFIHAYDNQLNSFGNEERVLILSVGIDKRILNELNFEDIDCSDSMSNFPHNMNFKKTKGFGAVSKVSLEPI